MADKYSTPPNNFPTPQEQLSPTKYLDLAGLVEFWARVKEYIDNADTTFDSKLRDLYDAVIGESGGSVDTTNGTLGERMSRVEGYVENISTDKTNSTYIDIDVTQDTGVDVLGKQTQIVLKDTELVNKISEIEEAIEDRLLINDVPETLPNPESLIIEYVDKDNVAQTITYDGSAQVSKELSMYYATTSNRANVAGEVDKELIILDANGSEKRFKGNADVDLSDGIYYASTAGNADKLDGYESNYFATADALSDLSDRVTTTEGFVKTVDVDSNGELISISIAPNNGDVKVSLDENALIEKFNEYTPTNELPDALPNPESLTIIDSTGKEVVYDGSTSVGIDSISYSATSGDSNKLDGHESDYFATAGALSDLSDRVTTTEGFVKTVNIDSNGELITLNITPNNGDVKVSLDDSAYKEFKETIESTNYVNTFGGVSGDITIDENNQTTWAVNFGISDNKLVGSVIAPTDWVKDIEVDSNNPLSPYVTISESEVDGVSTLSLGGSLIEKLNDITDDLTNHTHTGEQIALGRDLDGETESQFNQDTTVTGAIETLKEMISGLGKVVEIKGIIDSLPEDTTGYEDGDIIIISSSSDGEESGGKKEYLCFGGKWYLLGYTDEVYDLIDGLNTIYNSHTHNVTVTPTGEINNTINISAEAAANQNTVSVNSITSVGELPTATVKEIPTAGHTHSVTIIPGGTIENEFVGSSADTTATTAVVDVNSIVSVGELPTTTTKELPTKSHTHDVTIVPLGRIENTAGYSDITTSASVGIAEVASQSHTHTTQATSSAGVSVATAGHTHTTQASVDDATNRVVVASHDHTHTTDSTGSHTHTFSGSSAQSTNVATASSHDHTHTTNSAGQHNHTFNGSVENAGGTVSYANGILTINLVHTHTMTGTIENAGGHSHDVNANTTAGISVSAAAHTHEISGTIAENGSHAHNVNATGTAGSSVTTAAHTHAILAATNNTTNVINVASQTHTHNVDATTTAVVNAALATHDHTATVITSIDSVFIGANSTGTSTASNQSENITIIDNVGSLPTVEVIKVAADAHTHSVTAEGSVNSTFTGTESTINTGSANGSEEINIIDNLGSLPTIESISVAVGDHTHDVEVTGEITSEFVGDSLSIMSDQPTQKHTIS